MKSQEHGIRTSGKFGQVPQIAGPFVSMGAGGNQIGFFFAKFYQFDFIKLDEPTINLVIG